MDETKVQYIREALVPDKWMPLQHIRRIVKIRHKIELPHTITITTYLRKHNINIRRYTNGVKGICFVEYDPHNMKSVSIKNIY